MVNKKKSFLVLLFFSVVLVAMASASAASTFTKTYTYKNGGNGLITDGYSIKIDKEGNDSFGEVTINGYYQPTVIKIKDSTGKVITLKDKKNYKSELTSEGYWLTLEFNQTTYKLKDIKTIYVTMVKKPDLTGKIKLKYDKKTKQNTLYQGKTQAYFKFYVKNVGKATSKKVYVYEKIGKKIVFKKLIPKLKPGKGYWIKIPFTQSHVNRTKTIIIDPKSKSGDIFKDNNKYTLI